MITYKKLNLMSFERLNSEGIISFFTLKPYNFRKTQLTPDEINRNYEKIERDLDVKLGKIIKPIQTHTNIVRVVDEDNINDTFDNVDGLITNLKNVSLVTSLADCQGILLYDSKKQVIGNVHSGWKGTLGRIIENAINLMVETYNSNPSDIEAYINPSILKCCFEVDEDVALSFKKEFQDIKIDDLISIGSYKEGIQKYYIDTVEINKRVMMKLGLKEENIILSNICSKCNSNIIHSYRKDGIDSGRNVSLICME